MVQSHCSPKTPGHTTEPGAGHPEQEQLLHCPVPPAGTWYLWVVAGLGADQGASRVLAEIPTFLTPATINMQATA